MLGFGHLSNMDSHFVVVAVVLLDENKNDWLWTNH